MGRLRLHALQGAAMALALIPTLAVAALTVIYDSGDTQPIAPFLEVFASAGESPWQSPDIRKQPLGAADPASLLPIQSPGLTPGPVQTSAHEQPFARPFFLIGSDAQSRQWLQEHRDRLKVLGAVGMLVQADTLEDLRVIAELAQGLPILPASASGIAKALGVAHYPVVITAHGIEP